MVDRLGSDAVLDRAYRWLCKQRRRWPDAADVWSFRRDWAAEKERLRAELRAGTFRFGLLERIEKPDGEEIEVFPARDALVLKTLALVLEGVLPVSRRCTHVRGHGGAKAAVRRAAVRLRRLPFVICTDVRGYYANIDPVRLVERYRKNLSSLRGLWIDCGWRDQYRIHYGSRRLSEQLRKHRVTHRYEEFDATHSGIDYRMERSLPFLARALRA